jgi:hypothetical protein
VNVNLRQFKFTLLGGSCGFHISESMVSISYVSLRKNSSELDKGTGKVDSKVRLCKW